MMGARTGALRESAAHSRPIAPRSFPPRYVIRSFWFIDTVGLYRT
jgi:hypothetical protein